MHRARMGQALRPFPALRLTSRISSHQNRSRQDPDTQVLCFLQVNGFIQHRFRPESSFLWLSNVAKIGIRLRMARIESKLEIELSLRLVVVSLAIVEIAQLKMKIWLVGTDAFRRSEAR